KTSLRLRFIALSSDWCDRCSEPHTEGAARLRRQQASSEGGWHRVAEGARVLDAGNAMTDNSRKVAGGQVEALNASRKRLLLAADAERRRIERDLHEGVQQQLVALAVNLQLAGELTDSGPAAARTLLAEMERDVQRALDETAQLAQRI